MVCCGVCCSFRHWWKLGHVQAWLGPFGKPGCLCCAPWMPRAACLHTNCCRVLDLPAEGMGPCVSPAGSSCSCDSGRQPNSVMTGWRPGRAVKCCPCSVMGRDSSSERHKDRRSGDGEWRTEALTSQHLVVLLQPWCKLAGSSADSRCTSAIWSWLTESGRPYATDQI